VYNGQLWPLYIGGRSVEVFQSQLVSKLAWPDLAWPLLTGGRCSEVAVNTGLTVLLKNDLVSVLMEQFLKLSVLCPTTLKYNRG
jgi:hypothetical protein